LKVVAFKTVKIWCFRFNFNATYFVIHFLAKIYFKNILKIFFLAKICAEHFHLQISLRQLPLFYSIAMKTDLMKRN
jgi:hypothetical protein